MLIEMLEGVDEKFRKRLRQCVLKEQGRTAFTRCNFKTKQFLISLSVLCLKIKCSCSKV